MTSLGISMDLHVIVGPDDVVPLDEELDNVMTELVRLANTDCGLSDPAMSWNEENYVVSIEGRVTAEDWDAAVTLFDSCVRSAIHGAGGRTPNWTVEKKSEHVELVDA